MLCKVVGHWVGTDPVHRLLIILRSGDLSSGQLREVWGRGTNRVIAACERHGIALPTFEERQGFLIVTFKATISEAAEKTSKAPVMAPVLRLLELLFLKGTLGNADILVELGLKNRRRMRENYITPALEAGLIEYTIPDKPNSRLKKYRLTDKGKKHITKPAKDTGGNENQNGIQY